MKRTATAVWQGSGKEGSGYLNTKSGVLERTNYSYKSRFEDGKGTNPEELIAAAHSGCFTMALTFKLGEAGYTAGELQTECAIDFQDGTIVESHLKLKAEVEGIEEDEFDKIVNDAKENCPISKVLNTKITLEYTLN
ncbi:osmotically inducible protein OsmC [Lewinella marina]|uniref:OsmC family peroxiredoxin n=1 Tax=Neolewinella marina TaxID=438751 RepID=A0A2G0CIX4_9BACT|nr:OsmC family protein [Neolewinella marina]NJB84915.1 osmotically inducible protein OsmC [Neolewinella marina]PHK99932.1 OsmC family peroxiredoxin [Neolewinella marina]